VDSRGLGRIGEQSQGEVLFVDGDGAQAAAGGTEDLDRLSDAIGLVLGVVALAATLAPARTAMRVEPVVALRYE